MAEDKTKYTIADFVNQEIPPEILDQLKIANRIQFPLTPTTISAVSTSAQQPDAIPPEQDQNKIIDGLIEDVAEFEDLVEQLEDMVDEHLKDMEIPPASQRIADAIKVLDPNGNGNINKDVLDKALAIMDYLPMMTLGQDPVLAALVGDGTIEGPWMECNEITSALAKQITIPPRDEYDAEMVVKDQSNKIADNHEKRMLEMMLETLLMLWWNMLWPKMVVDAVIINPLRMAFANPIDSLITFFKNVCDVRKFKKKSKECIQKKGPLNKLLNRLRLFLLCKIPPKVYDRYKPMVEIKCPENDEKCPPETTSKEFEPDNKNAMTQLGEMVDSVTEGNCFTDEELLSGIDNKQPEGFGASPTCTKAAKIVLDAVLADALTSPSGESATKKILSDQIKTIFEKE